MQRYAIAICLMFVACGSSSDSKKSDDPGDTDTGGDPGVNDKVQCSAIDGGGCSCVMGTTDDTTACASQSLPAGALCCTSGSQTDGTLVCSCELRPVTTWSCYAIDGGCACSDTSLTGTHSGAAVADCSIAAGNQDCGYDGPSHSCLCYAHSIEPYGQHEDSCNTAPTGATGPCPASTFQVDSCPPPADCDATSCNGSVQVGDQFCARFCQNNRCVEQCNNP